MKDVKCPVCGSRHVEVDDVIDLYGDEDNNGVELLGKNIVGHCEDCGVELMWEQIFRHFAIKNLKRI